jgi:hypothetical protein
MGAFRCGKQGLKLEGADEMLGSSIELKKKRPKTQTDWITPTTIAS